MPAQRCSCRLTGQEVRRGRAGRPRRTLGKRASTHDGYECLGRLYQATGDYNQAADCYRKVIEFACNEPHLYDPDFVGHFQDLNHLEPQAAAG